MRALPYPNLENTDPEQAQSQNPSDAACSISAAELLVTSLMDGTALTAPMLRFAMEDAFGASDTDGAWIWKDAYEAAEIAQIMILHHFGAAMQRQAKSPSQFLSMIEKLSALVPTQTRRSEDMVALQQFSTPLPFAAIAAQAAAITKGDFVLEPSAGTGMLAIFAKTLGARLALNELADTRSELLRSLFPDAVLSTHDASSIDDRLDGSVAPSVVLMNPPFSVAPNVDGRFKAATSRHVQSALARLKPGGRLVAITGANFNPSNKAFRSAYEHIAEMGKIVLSAPVAGKVFIRHGTNVDTRLTVIDKNVDGTRPNAVDPSVFFPIMENLDELFELVFQETPPRKNVLPPAEIITTTRNAVLDLRNAARAESQAIAFERAMHPFDTGEATNLD